MVNQKVNLFCPKCGNKLKEGDTFCRKCGVSQEVSIMPPSISVQPSVQTEYPSKETKPKKKWWVAPLVVSLFTVVTFAVILPMIQAIGDKKTQETVDKINNEYRGNSGNKESTVSTKEVEEHLHIRVRFRTSEWEVYETNHSESDLYKIVFSGENGGKVHLKDEDGTEVITGFTFTYTFGEPGTLTMNRSSGEVVEFEYKFENSYEDDENLTLTIKETGVFWKFKLVAVRYGE